MDFLELPFSTSESAIQYDAMDTDKSRMGAVPERALWAATLRQLAQDWHGVGVIKTEAGKTRAEIAAELHDMAEAHIASDSDTVGSFRWICEILDLDAMALSRGLKTQTAKIWASRAAT